MTRRIAFWILGSLLGLLLLVTALLALVLGTHGGTRWLIGLGSGYLPGTLAIQSVEGSLLAGVRLGEVSWRGEREQADINHVLLEVDLLPLLSGEIAVRQLLIDGPRVVVTPSADTGEGNAPLDLDVNVPVLISVATATISDAAVRFGEVDLRLERIYIEGSLDGARLALDQLDLQTEWLEFALQGRGRLQGRIPLRLQARWSRTVAGEPALAGELELRGDTGSLELKHALTAPLALNSSGTLGLLPALQFDLDNRWQSLEWPLGERRLYAGDGLLHVAGNPAEFAVELDTVARLDDLPMTTISLVGNATPESILVDFLELSNSLGRLTASGPVAWLPAPVADVDFELTELDSSMLAEALSGELAIRGSARIALMDSAPDIAAQLDEIGGLLNEQAVSGSAAVTYRDETLTVSAASLAVGSNSVRASGSLGDQLQVDGTFEVPVLDEFDLGIAGELRGTASMHGPLAAPSLALEATAATLAFGSTRIDAATISIDGTALQHGIGLALDAYEQRLELSARGGLADARWTGRIDSLQFSSEVGGSWTSTASAQLSAGAAGIGLSQLCVAPAAAAGRACASVDYDPAGATEFSALLEGFPLAALPFTPPRDVRIAGDLNISAEGSFQAGSLSAEAQVELADTAVSASYEGEITTVAIARAIAATSIVGNRLEATTQLTLGEELGEAQARIVLGDIFDARSAIEGNASLSMPDAAFFAAFVPSITNPGGRISGELAVGGTLALPEFVGAVVLEDGAFSVRPAGVDIKDVQIRLQQSGPASLQLEGSAHSGKGSIAIAGNTLVSSETGIRTEINLTGTDFQILRLPDWQVAASPDIDIVFDERAIDVSGQLGIPRADVTVKSAPETAQGSSPDTIVHREEVEEPAADRPINLDIVTTLGPNVRLSGFGLTTGLEGKLQLRGGTQKPLLGYGRVQLRDGSYSAYGQDLTIASGDLIWNGPLDSPRLDIRATRDAGEVTAGIHLTGTPTQLRSEVFSEPPLSDADTLSYLLTGRPLSSATTAGEGDALNQAAFALGLSQAGAVVSQIGGALGLETLSVEGGADSGRIVAGKRIGGRLLVEYGYGIVDGLGTLLLRYQLNDRLVLESRTGTESNLDIVYSVKKQ